VEDRSRTDAKKEISMLGRKNSQRHVPSEYLNDGNASPLFTVVGSDARLEGTFDVADSIQIECEVGGRMKVGKKLVIGERGCVRADVQTVDAIIYGQYEGNMVATGSVEITPTGRMVGNVETHSLVISKGGLFNGHVAKLTESEAEGSLRPVSVIELGQIARLRRSKEEFDSTSGNGHVPELLLVLLSAIALVGGGCAGVSMAAGPLLSVLQAIGARSVEQTLAADLETAWTATVDTLTRMEIRIQETDRNEEAWSLEGVGDEVTVYAKLVPVTPQMTKVFLRAEAGGLLADKETAEEILNQLALSVVPPSAVVVREPSAERDTFVEELAALEEQVRQLKLAIEDQEKDRVVHRPQLDPNEGVNAVVSNGSRIMTIPPSYGIRKLPIAADATDSSSPPVELDKGVAVIDDAPPAADEVQETLPAPLIRANVLTPLPAARGSRHSPANQP
jgi:cytoskeletal protein CcmA (bactofilin family)